MTGTNTMQMHNVETNAGTAIWLAPSRMALMMGLRWPMLRWMFSISTVASSTRMPTARAKPPSVMTLMVSPSRFSTASEVRMESGMEMQTMMVDDAHASGVLGRQGRGTVDHFGMHGRVDIQVGTLSKAIGALGGYVCGTRELIDFLYHRARPFLFSTSHPPSVAATCIAAFDVLENEPERMEKLWENTRFWKKELGLLGFDIGGRATPASETPITPIIIGDGKLTMDFSRELFKEGVLGTGIAFPTVPEG